MTTTGAPGRRRGIEIAPLRGLRYDFSRVGSSSAGHSMAEVARCVTSPPYDVISPEEHRRLLAASPHNITWVTLGSEPGGASGYDERARLLDRWVTDGVLVRDAESCLYAYTIDYGVPGAGPDRAERRRFVGLIALGRLHAFEEGVVLPHEKTFPKVVEDRFRLLTATRANLENILLLYSDPQGVIDALLEAQCRGEPAARVEAKPGEFHAIYPFCDVATLARLVDLFSVQRPIIADGHHRYTTSLRFSRESGSAGRAVSGAEWQMMTFANLYSRGLSILATHRLVKLSPGSKGAGEEAVDRTVAGLLSRLEAAPEGQGDFRIETRGARHEVRFPAAVRAAGKGVGRTAYALLHDVVIGDWLRGAVDSEGGIQYFKEGTGETEALARGDGDILFRMRPVDREEFESVVQGGEVFPHKTTYFYPKLWSGLVLWRVEEPDRLALK